METSMRSHQWEQRAPDWVAATVSGFAAGAVLMVLDLLWSASMGMSPWLTSQRVAAIVMGPDVLQASGFDARVVATALLTHYVLGIAFSLLLAAVVASFHLGSSEGMTLSVGAVFGVALYLLNFYGMVYFFEWFADMRSGATFLAHVIFGMVAGYMYSRMQGPARTSDARR